MRRARRTRAERECELRTRDLRWRCLPREVHVGPSSPEPAIGPIIGQERALDALRLGLELYAPGYNVFVCGISGTGKATTVKRILESIQPRCELARDRAYVMHFREPQRPMLLTFERSMARQFRRDMKDLLQHLLEAFPSVYEGETYVAHRKTLSARYETRQKELFAALEKKLKAEGFTLAQVQIGPIIKPEIFYLVEGQPVALPAVAQSAEEGKLPGVDVAKLQARHEELSEELADLLRMSRRIHHAMLAEMRQLDRRAAAAALIGPFQELRERWDEAQVQRYLRGLEEFILDNLELFRGEDQENGRKRTHPRLARAFHVNVILDNFRREGCPVEIANHPTLTNLFGTIELSPSRNGAPRADHTGIRAGALLAADGGYLVVNARDVLLQRGVWPTLKRTLKSRLLEIAPNESGFPFVPVALRPEPIAINVKVVMIGESSLYHQLFSLDEDFGKIFKVKADFETEMDREPENIRRYAAVLRRRAAAEELGSFTDAAIARVVEHGVRKASRRSKLTTQLGRVVDVLRESSYWARREGRQRIDRGHVEHALAEAVKRERLPEERLQQLIQEGRILLDTDGSRVGVVNGLAVYDLGSHAFGKPSRITAAVGMGRGGIVNIEREVELSGSTYDKGVLILAGFLRERFARDRPLNLTASICFEQSYGGVDGDSASSSEVYALLSALSGVPLRQSIAVTGSVNQKGEIQPIGGVNEKVEGFFDVCRLIGLTGRQGVMIPERNRDDLMLRDDVIDAVRKGRFHLWAVRTIDEGIEILTAVPAGAGDARGRFPPGTVNGLADARLEELALGLRDFENGGEEGRKGDHG